MYDDDNPPAPLWGHQAVEAQSAVLQSCISQSFSFYSPSFSPVVPVQQSVVLLVLGPGQTQLPSPDHIASPPWVQPSQPAGSQPASCQPAASQLPASCQPAVELNPKP